MNLQDEKLERILADPWLARPLPRWSLSVTLILVAMFMLKPLIINQLIARAEAYSSYGLYTNAARECKKVISIDKNNHHAWNLLGSSYKNQDDIDNAITTFLNAINVDLSNKVAHFKVAMILTMQENYNMAIPHFEYIRSVGPESPAVLIDDPFPYYRSSLDMLSLCYERAGKLDKQQAVLEELAKTYPNYTKASEKLRTLGQSSHTSTNP